MKQLILLFSLLAGFHLTVVASDPILYFDFNEPSGATFITEAVSGTQFPLNDIFNSPQRIQAPSGSALRLDGYSTFAQSNYIFNQVDRQLTIEAWYAPEAFSPSTNPARDLIEGAAIISQIKNGAGFALEIGSYGHVSLDFYADSKKYEVTTASTIKKYAWNHIVATVDLDTREARIYVNGNLWETALLEGHTALTFANDVPMYVGRHNSTQLIEGFNITTLNGALDDLKLFNTATATAEVVSRYEALAPQVVAEIVYEDFEAENYGNWAVAGDAFGTEPASGALTDQLPVEGFRGTQLVNSFLGGDPAQGKMTSPDFTIHSDLIKLLVGGGNHPRTAEVRLLINGAIVQAATGNNAETLTERTWNVSEFIGETAQLEIVDSVTGGWGHILVDHIVFTDEQELLPADNLIFDPAVRHAGDHLRPQYHAMPATSWANEPYGLTYYNGKYHLFFQKNPNGLWLHFMHWGHVSSPDLVQWQEEKIALAPSPGFDDFGIWSGTTIKDQNGVPVIFYTGVDLGRAGIGVAFPKDDDLIEWEKYSNNPVVPATPSGLLDFRDPYVWEDNGAYYMVVGSGYAGGSGGVLPTYKSTDLVNWTQIQTLYNSVKVEESGFFWEMPLFYPLNDQGEYILMVTPLYQGKPASVIYWIGKWENEKFEPYDTTPKLLERVRDNTLAPAIGTDEEGRITYIGIVPEHRNVGDQLAAGWRQAFSLPRVIRLLEDTAIGQYPHPNLCRLRQNEVAVSNRVISKGTNGNLAEFGGNQTNLKFTIKADSASKFSLQLLKNAEGNQFTTIQFDLKENEILLDTRFSHFQAAETEYKAFNYAFDDKEEIQVEVFIDHSVVEVFIDNLLVISARVYPAENSQLVDMVVSAGQIEIMEAKQWDMQDMTAVTGTEVCGPANLPTQFRELPDEGVEPEPEPNGINKNEELRKTLNIYPNPANDVLKVEIPAHLGSYEVSVISLSGAKVLSAKNQLSKQSISLAAVPKGVYMVQVKGKTFSEFFKIIIQ